MFIANRRVPALLITIYTQQPVVVCSDVRICLLIMLNNTDNNDASSCGSGSSGGSGKLTASWKQQLVCSHHPTDGITQQLKPTRGKTQSPGQSNKLCKKKKKNRKEVYIYIHFILL